MDWLRSWFPTLNQIDMMLEFPSFFLAVPETLRELAGKWGMTSDHPEWKDEYDFDGDEKVTVIDLQALQGYWNESCP